MTDFQALVRVIQQSGASIQSQFDQSEEPTSESGAGLPLLYLAHLVLDGKEYSLALTPTDLRDVDNPAELADGKRWAALDDGDVG